MLRRFARSLRTGLFLAGMMFLVLVPISSFVYFNATVTWPRWELASIIIHLGRLEVRWVSGAPEHIRSGVGFAIEGPRAPVSWVPEIREVSTSHWRWRSAVAPLWLLAAVCLAWPVTSFIVARRRRRGRGFEVEATAGGAVSMADD